MPELLLRSVKTEAKFKSDIIHEDTPFEQEVNKRYDMSVTLNFTTSGAIQWDKKKLEIMVSELLFNQLQKVEL